MALGRLCCAGAPGFRAPRLRGCRSAIDSLANCLIALYCLASNPDTF
jgi:hypothetical protein